MKTYEKIESEYGICIKMTDEEGVVSFIPPDSANSDYQAYLKSLDEASTL
jgi:hypothetical protein